MSLRHRQPFTCRFPEELRAEMDLWTRANDSSQAELVRRVVREFLDQRPLKELGIDIDSLGLSAPPAKRIVTAQSLGRRRRGALFNPRPPPALR